MFSPLLEKKVGEGWSWFMAVRAHLFQNKSILSWPLRVSNIIPKKVKIKKNCPNAIQSQALRTPHYIPLSHYIKECVRVSLSHAAACIGCAYPKPVEAEKKATPVATSSRWMINSDTLPASLKLLTGS